MSTHDPSDAPGRLTRRQLLAGGAGLLGSLAAGGLLSRAWTQLGREDLVPGEPPDMVLEPEAWTTSPDRAALAVVGDNGSGGRQAMAVAEQMARSYREAPFGSVSLLGDICYYGPIGQRFPDVFVEPMRPLLDAGVTFELAIGNHDGGLFRGDARLAEVERTLERLGTPSRYYTVRRGPVDLFYLDSVGLVRAGERGPLDEPAVEQLAWLDRSLAEATGTWRVVCTHHPVWSSGIHGPTPILVDELQPLLADHGVDLLLAGHDHHYERTHAIEGTTHVVSGAGCKLTPVEPSRITARAASELEFVRLDATADRLVGRAIGVDGQDLDRFELVPRRQS